MVEAWQKSARQPTRPWLTPMFMGVGVGIAIALGGMGVLTQLPARQDKAVANKITPKSNPVLTVTVSPVETTRVSRTLNTTGTIAARDLIPVLPQANGLQVKIIPEDIKEGTYVKKGQVLAILDDSMLQAQMSGARAEVESKQADVGSKQAGVVSQQATVASYQAIVRQRKADLAQSKAKLEEAQKNYLRYRKLAMAGAISLQELDTRAYTVKTATEAVRLAEENIRSAQANVISAQATTGSAVANIYKAEADVRTSVAKVVQIQTQLKQTVVRAPISGIVAEKLARVGDVTGIPPQTQVGTVIGGTQKLFSIIRDGRLELQAEVPEIQLPQVEIGAAVQITSDIDNRVQLQGRVREIQPLVNDKRREATVKIDLPLTNLLRPGMFARAAITTNTALAMAVPQKAVQPQADGSAIVYTLSGDDLVQSQKVEVGEPINSELVEIKNGLQLGDRVIVDGAGYLKDGDRVKVTGDR
ncbi:efflux RND transporter periplasmic adaptor subunit [Nostoc sp. FACHB-87]|uniref:efflux RND transporter periplasmic adaptor subunit n=1 Tax=Nostocaceae TaxID=1162 RepID=UPI0016822ECB|nr:MULTISPECIES: efflux RND transporter periplasmic adaptor subunit [Nostocaceae]MBD2455226.1 efflux RND transporter periplasmic adaptor subunit [Nostoc sp. FACHB-87]MBD2476949.1 efflux RND transporter periplasmic adaptor subunit [Anabaena sp. FACHB-83]